MGAVYIRPLLSGLSPGLCRRPQAASHSTYLTCLSHTHTITHHIRRRCSADGVVKFWKKAPGDVEFVKTFKAHLGPIASLALSADGLRLCSAGCDRALKLFDVGASARCR